MDRVDWKIVRELERDARISFAELGERVGLSKSPCWSRVRDMQADGTIRGCGAQLDPKALERVLVSVGKQKVREKVADELGLEGEKVDEAKQLLKGLFDRKKKE